MQQEKFIIASKMDKTPLSVLMVTPDGAPKGLVQFSHGMAEHKERYLRVMCLLAAEGYASIIHDHRGHGESVRAQQDLGYFYSAGADGVTADLAQVNALLRRAQMVAERRLTVGSTTLDYDAFSVRTGAAETVLPQKEFQLLYKLLSTPGHIFTRQQLMDDIWGPDSETEARTVDVHINRLRDRFCANPDFSIQTVRGIGYKAVKHHA